MAQVDLVKRVGASYVWIESGFGLGTGTPLRWFPKEGSMLKTAVEPVKNEDERSTPYANIAARKGRQSSEATLNFAAKAHGAILTEAGVVSAVMPTSVICKGLMGTGSQLSGVGGTITASTTASATLSAGEGAHWVPGQWASFPYLGQWYPRRITAIASETLTFQHIMPGVPTITTGIAHNSMTFVPTWTQTQSLAVAHAQVHPSLTTYQWQTLGMTGSLKLALAPGKEILFTAELKGADFQGPVDLSLSTAVAADAESAPFYFNGNATVWLQAATSTGTTHYPVQKIDISVDLGNILKMEFGGVQGVTGVARDPKRPIGTVKVTHTADIALNTDFDAGTAYSLIVIQPLLGTSGATQRHFFLDIPYMTPIAKPDYTGDNDGLRTVESSWEMGEDQSCSSNITDGSRAPFRFGWL